MPMGKIFRWWGKGGGENRSTVTQTGPLAKPSPPGQGAYAPRDSGSRRQGRLLRQARELWHWICRRWPKIGPWMLVAFCWLVPLLVLIGVGSYWLYVEGWLLTWFIGAAVLGIFGWAVSWMLLRKKVTFPGPEVKPALDWPPRGVAAWEEVEKLAAEAENSPPAYNDWEGWRKLVTRVLEAVAQHYYPNTSAPLLEVSAPRILRIVELVARDLRRTICDHVPFADRLTIGDLQRAYYLQGLLGELYRLYRLVAVGVNPAHGVARFVRDLAVQRLQETTADAVLRWAARYVVQRTGYYAIMLYGGYLILDGEEFSEYQTPQSRRELEEGQRELTRVKGEPLRILVVGRAGAGKSSVINAFCDQIVAAPGVSCRKFTSYPLPPTADGLPKLAIESPGSYFQEGKDPFRPLRDQVLMADAVVLVVRLDEADWKPEKLFLERLREEFLRDPDRHMPPILIIGTRADCLVGVEGSKDEESGQKMDRRGKLLPPVVDKALEKLKLELGTLAGGPVIGGCFKAPAPIDVRRKLEGAWAQIEDFARVVHLTRVRRSLNQFSLWRDLVKPASTTAGRLLGTVWGILWRSSKEG